MRKPSKESPEKGGKKTPPQQQQQPPPLWEESQSSSHEEEASRYMLDNTTMNNNNTNTNTNTSTNNEAPQDQVLLTTDEAAATSTTLVVGGSSTSTIPATLSQCSFASSMYSNNNNNHNMNTNNDGSSRISAALVWRQVQLLSGMSGMSLVVLVLSCLNGLAIVALGLMLVSSVLLVQVGTQYVRLEYERNPRLFYDQLPSSLQSYLTSTTLHEYMTSTEGSPYMEYRYLLLYFLPGLTEDQLHMLLRRLPPRHRDLLFQPGGIARILLPSSLLSLLTPPSQQQLQQEEPSSMLVHNNNTNNNDNPTDEPTVQDAIVGILGTVRQLFPHYSSSSSQPQPQPSSSTTNHVTMTPILNDMTWEEDTEDEHDDIIVPPTPPPTTVNAVLQNDDNHQDENEDDDDLSTQRHEQYQLEYATEEAILTDAITATITNYATSASHYLMDTVESALETYTPRIIQGGFTLSLLSTIGYFGVLRHTTTTTTTTTSRSHYHRFASYSLLATSVMGTASAGMAYAARSWIRNKVHKQRRQTNHELEEGEGEETKEKDT